MGMVKARAPGKLLLTGEYAVLAGACAISLAVDRRARVRVSCGDKETGVIRTVGFAERTLEFRRSPAGGS